jgi:ATP-dependent RNA helicase DDX21
VGTETHQLPNTIETICVLCNTDSQKHTMLKDFILKNLDKKILIFTETKAECAQFASQNYAEFMPLHGDMEQKHRQKVLDKFRSKDCKGILVATDVAARGLDIDDIDVVVHFSVRHVDSFVHRSGRTGRAGKSGTNLLLCSKQDLPFLKECENALNIRVKL